MATTYPPPACPCGHRHGLYCPSSIPESMLPRAYCGCPMPFVGYGSYPYDCIAKDRYPYAPIYMARCEHSHAWKSDRVNCPPNRA